MELIKPDNEKCVYCNYKFEDMDDEIRHMLDDHGTYCVANHAEPHTKKCYE